MKERTSETTKFGRSSTLIFLMQAYGCCSFQFLAFAFRDLASIECVLPTLSYPSLSNPVLRILSSSALAYPTQMIYLFYKTDYTICGICLLKK